MSLVSPSDNFPGGSDGKAPAYNVGDQGSYPWVRKISWRSKWQPTPVFLPGKSHGWRSLVGPSPWGRKESDMTERLHLALNLASLAGVGFNSKHDSVPSTVLLGLLLCPWTNILLSIVV